MPSSPITWWQTEGEKVETVADFIFLGSKITVASDCSHEIKRCLLLGRKAMTKLRQCIRKQRYHFANKGLYTQSYGVFSSQVLMWELDHKDRAPKNRCFQIVKLEKTLESPMDCSMPGFPVFHYFLEFCSNSCPLSQWCYLTISSSAAPFSFAFSLSQQQYLFQ